MTAPAVFKERSLMYENDPSVLATAEKCRDAKDPNSNPHPIQIIYLPMRKSKAPGAPHETTAEEVMQVRNTVERPGLWMDPRWMSAGTSTWKDLYGKIVVDPLVFRKAVSKELIDLYTLHDPVLFNWEKFSSDWIITFLLGRTESNGFLTQGWRGRGGFDNNSGANPWRESAWVDAAFQTGNYNSTVLDLLDKFGFAAFIEMFYGGMAPVLEREDAIRELRDFGRLNIDVYPCYDAKAEAQPGPNSWRRGVLFTSNRWNYLFS